MKRTRVKAILIGAQLLTVTTPWMAIPQGSAAETSPSPTPSPMVSGTSADLLEAPITAPNEPKAEPLAESKTEAEAKTEVPPAPPLPNEVPPPPSETATADDSLAPLTEPLPEPQATEMTPPVAAEAPLPAPEAPPVSEEKPTSEQLQALEPGTPPTETLPQAVTETPPEAPPASAETPPPPTAEPPPAEVASEVHSAPETPTASSSADVARFQRVSAYKKALPHWGVEFAASNNALGRQNITPLQAGIPARSFILHADYQSPWIQKQGLGVIGIGPSIGLYPMTSDLFGGDPRATDTNLSNWEVGGQIRYQARFFIEQPLVPVLGFQLESFHYNIRQQTTNASNQSVTNRVTGSVLLTGPSLGLWLLLNIVEPGAAADFYINQGVSRSYLVAEYRSLSGSDSNVSVSGGSYYLGVRIEF